MVWSRLAERWRQAREQAVLERRAIDEGLWKRTLVRYPFLRRKADPKAAELRRLVSLFLDRKEFTAVGGLRLTNDVVVAVAAQACVPVLRLGLNRYDGFVGIVLHPDQVHVNRSVVDEDGIVHEYEDALSGETVDGGPVMLSWRDVRTAGRSAAEGYNVVIHEFAHVLDMAQGLTDGAPRGDIGCPPAEWQATWQREYEGFAERVDAQAPTLLDPYGAESPSEFFAVASEAFFVAAPAFAAEHPALYDKLARFYRQDPAAETG